MSSKAPPLPFCSRLADSHICAVLSPHRFTFVQRLMSLLCRGPCNGILTFVTKTALILCQGEGRWGLCTAEVDHDDDMTLAIVHSFQDYLAQGLDESTSDNDDEQDHSSEGFFLQCGAVPASIMPASDPLSAPFALAGQHTQLLTLH